MRVKDQVGRLVEIPARAGRIVSLVPSQTELLVSLGLEDQLVGVTKFCVHPDYLRKTKLVVGGTKKVNYHKIRSLNPDLIVANKEENTLEMVRNLEEIAPVWVSDVPDYRQALDMIGRLGAILDKEKNALALIDLIEKKKAEFLSQNSQKPVKAAYLIWYKPLMAAGNDTFIESMLSLAGFKNVVGQSRYPEVNKETLQDAEVILLSSEPFPFEEKHLKTLESHLEKPCLLVDGECFSWYGSRMTAAFDYFNTLRAQLV